MTDIVSIRDLTVNAVIGVYDWERETTQDLVVTIDMAADTRRASASDDIADALDYSAIAERVTSVLRDGKFQLIETAAERIAEAVQVGYGVSWVRVEILKPLPGERYSSSVVIERGHRPSSRF